ncbi:amino acid permease [Streptomyces sp. NPDC050315]|uniref:amino acid permease n=1 Tax=Streptomyces sp. NPDC050315 TaxID=3155039 RepID=UPI003421B658
MAKDAEMVKDAVTAEDTATGLRRGLTQRQMTLLGLGSALGTGLFLGAGTAIGTAGPAVLVSYAVGAVIALTIAFALAEMVSALPVRGTFGTIAARYLGPFAGYAVRWLYWIGVILAVGSEVVAAAIYLTYWWPQLPLALAVAIFAVLIAAVNLAGVKSFGSLESVLSAVKVIAIVVFLVIGAALVFFGLPDRRATGLSNLTAHGGFFPNGGIAVWLVMAVVIFSFAGIELIAISAPETENAPRALRTAMRSMMLRLSLFYLGALAVILAVTPWQQANSNGSVQSSPFVTMFSAAGIPAAAAVTNALVLITALSAANANLYAGTRMLHSLGSDGLAPASLAATDAHGVPRRAVLASASGMVLAAVLTGFLGSGVASFMMSLASIAVISTWIIILLTLMAFRRHRDRPASTLRLRGGRAVPVLAIIALLSVLATGLRVPEMLVADALGLPTLAVLGAVYYFRYHRRVRLRKSPQLQENQ